MARYVSRAEPVVFICCFKVFIACAGGEQCAAVGMKAEKTPFGLDAVSASVTPTSLHDDFVNMMKSQGLEKMATEIGILKNGALVDTPRACTETPRKGGSGPKQAPETPTFASPSFTSPCVSPYFFLRAQELFFIGLAGVVVGHRERTEDT